MKDDMNSVYERLCHKIVGRKQEIGIILSAIRAKLPILLIGMPGVSKTTILNAISQELHGNQHVFQVTGDEQLSAYSLVGSFDPALVIKDGYKLEYFSPGPLTKAMRQGGILYIEEFNRAPSGALNVLMTALSDGYIEIPRYGRVMAESGFTLIGSSNPIDDVGTERLSRGLADRFVMLELAYQSEDEEIEIVRRKHPNWSLEWIRYAVHIARASRVHPDLRYGSSIRGSIFFLSLLSSWCNPSEDLMFSSGVSAFLGKIQVKSSSGRTGAEIIREIMTKELTPDKYENFFEQWQKSVELANQDSSGGALVEAGGGGTPQMSKGGAIREPTGPSPPLIEMAWEGSGAGGTRGASDRTPSDTPFMDLQVRTTQTVNHLKQYREKPWIPLNEVEHWIEQSTRTIRNGKVVQHGLGGTQLLSKSWEMVSGGEIDIDGTLSRMIQSPSGIQSQDIQIRYRTPMKKDFIVFIDHSGSMVGNKLVVSAVLTGSLASLGAREQCRYGVYAFDQEISEIKQLQQKRDVKSVISEIMYLPEGRSTDLSLALRFAMQLQDDEADVDVILVSDCMPTRGEKMFHSLNKIVQRMPNLYICYVSNSVGGDFSAETLTGICKLDLYGWWGYKWVGSDRFYVINDLDDLPHVVNLLIGHQRGVLV